MRPTLAAPPAGPNLTDAEQLAILLRRIGELEERAERLGRSVYENGHPVRARIAGQWLTGRVESVAGTEARLKMPNGDLRYVSLAAIEATQPEPCHVI